MLHPSLTYLGDAIQYRTADGKLNDVLVPHLGQAGALYAKTVPSKIYFLSAQPDPGTSLSDSWPEKLGVGRVHPV